jgi:hypothetical protein
MAPVDGNVVDYELAKLLAQLDQLYLIELLQIGRTVDFRQKFTWSNQHLKR